jgi:hypothetical protein
MMAFLEALKASGKFKKIHHFFISLITGTAMTSPRCYLLIALSVTANGTKLPEFHHSQSEIPTPYDSATSSSLFKLQQR